MKVNYQETLDKAKDLGLISQDDKYVFCTVRPKDVRNMGVMKEVKIMNIKFGTKTECMKFG